MSAPGWSGYSKKLFAAALLLFCAGFLFISYRYQARPWDVPVLVARKLATPILASIHSEDATKADFLSASYFHAAPGLPEGEPWESWRAVSLSGNIVVLGGSGLKPLQRRIPFVFESPDAPYLAELLQSYQLHELLPREAGEYDKMLALFAWLGTRWDHGADPVPGGLSSSPPAEIIAAGERGARFWCEVCARVTVQAATALGWPARLITASSDGYRWEHALAEVWSNQFNKWFLVDTDYNIVYEARGVPLSAYEMCHLGPELQASGVLKVRRFAPLKRSLREVDLLRLYRYVHLDLRNDWYSRRLQQGSPAGGDLATWWTGRADLGPLLTSKNRVDSQELFDWPVNATEIHASEVRELDAGRYLIALALRGYSPYFRRFLIRVDQGAWLAAPDARGRFELMRGRHVLETRIESINGDLGPVASVEILLH